jgi:multidrug efflux pump subunit AcrB
LIIDDAIVMCEHIVRRLHASHAGNATESVQTAATEFSKPLAGSSLSTIIIHIPPAFLVGVAGAFFAALSLSMASSLIISFFIAWLIIPVLAGKFLRRASHQPPVDQSRARSHQVYAKIMGVLLRVPWVVALIAIGLGAVGYLAYTRLPSGFMPSMDEGGFIIDYVTPPGTSLTETDRILKTVESVLHDTPEVQTFSRRTGFSMGGDFSEANSGDFFVQLKPLPRRDIDDVMSDVRTRIEHSLPGVDFELSQLMEDIIGDITGRPEPVVINLFSEDERVLQKLAPEVKEKISKIDGIVEPVSGIIPAGDSLTVQVDRTKASLEGVDPAAVSKQLSDELSGDVATQVQIGEKLVGVRVWLPLGVRKKDSDIAELPIRAPDGHVFPLKKIASIETVSGEPEINRVDLKRVVSVTARIEGRDLGSTVNDVRAALDSPGVLPAGVRYTLGGLYEQQQIAFRGLLLVIIAATTLVLLLLLFLYESFRIALSILITTLLAIAFVFGGLWLTGTELNISSLMGMVMIVGNVTEVAIFYCSELIDFPHEGSLSDRLIVAGENRMRAIVMTTVAAILALLPLALNIGHGSSILQPLSIAIITGLIAQLPLVLIVLPMLLRILRVRVPSPGTPGEG